MRWERARAYGLAAGLLLCAAVVLAAAAYGALRAATPWG